MREPNFRLCLVVNTFTRFAAHDWESHCGYLPLLDSERLSNCHRSAFSSMSVSLHVLFLSSVPKDRTTSADSCCTAHSLKRHYWLDASAC
jgi:hypothetical protein